MTYPLDDLAPLWARDQRAGIGAGQGIVRSWNPITAENVIEVDGALLENLPILNTNEALLLTEGDVVGLLKIGSSWAIVGRWTIPGTPAAASALAAIRTEAASTGFYATVNTTSWTDPDGRGPSVTVRVGKSGRLLVMVSCWWDYSSTNQQQGGGYMGFEISGATSVAPNERMAVTSLTNIYGTPISYTIGDRMTAVSLVTGLNPGIHTVAAKYRAAAPGSTCGLSDRAIIAIPL